MNYQNNCTQVAVLNILYSEEPVRVGDRFLQIRQWVTPSGEYSDLIVETGRLQPNDDLETECRVMPFYNTVADVISTLAS